MLAYPLFSKLVTPGESTVPREVVETWLERNRCLQVGPKSWDLCAQPSMPGAAVDTLGRESVRE